MSFRDELRKAIEQSGMSRYGISLRTGIAQSILSRFMAGEAGLSMESVDKLWDCLGLSIARRRKSDKQGS